VVISDQTGIWSIESGNSKKVIETAFEAMAKGDHIENDLEAICYAIKKYPENKQNVVLIADNWENPCDMALLSFLKSQKIPIKIIVCGVTDRMNTLYLDIAYATGGSIHTMEQDLIDVAKIGEGKTIKLNGMKFKMTGGKFVQM
jgi:alpha-L-arabinofuranosidase